ncbi:MAG TPA: STAS domain-containing protein [Spirochaetota bacterium]|nr:STAS domain-containing protein [Spirochaetota bacterium]HRZ26326.1 STAS domain-containing protein [Spirochaetota bacterium]HSA14494.1 STAS domain-containing protein [Spirochaetota bacterium]
MSSIHISKRTKYGYDIFDIEGEISFDDSRMIEDYVKENATGEYPSVILNLARVPFINSSALAFFVKLMQALSERKISMYLMNANETIQGLLDITGTTRHFRIIKNEDSLTDNVKMKELDRALDLDE